MSISIPNEQLSKYFTLADLTASSEHPDIDNTPDVMSLANLRRLALQLDLIYDALGPFTVTSAFRSPALNAALSAGHVPSTTSEHLYGMAADLSPEIDTPYNYFLKLIRSTFFPQIGQLINETASQGIVHVSLASQNHAGEALYLSNGNYYHYSPDQIYTLQVGTSDDEEVETDDSTAVLDNVGDVEDVSVTPIAMIALGAATFLIITVLLASRRSA